MKAIPVKAVKFLLLMTILTGLIYPLIITGIAQLIFPYTSNGSLLLDNGEVIGSEIIGQKFDSSIYFWSRPSAIEYNPIPSGATNFGPTSDTLMQLVTARRIIFARENLVSDSSMIPSEMIFASGSGLDPHISTESALLQAERISVARNLDDSMRENLIESIRKMAEEPQFGILGKERINVFLLNINLDKSLDTLNYNK